VVKFRIIGNTSLLVHRFGPKAEKQIADNEQGRAKGGRGDRNPEEEYEEAKYIFPSTLHLPPEKQIHGIPAAGIRHAMVRAAKSTGTPMSDAITYFYVLGEEADLVRLHYEHEAMACHPVRLQKQSLTLRYRPEYTGWWCDVPVLYRADVTNPEKLASWLEIAGFGVGLCEWRGEKGGNHGLFNLAVE
jgi:hypothetical protein